MTVAGAWWTRALSIRPDEVVTTTLLAAHVGCVSAASSAVARVSWSRFPHQLSIVQLALIPLAVVGSALAYAGLARSIHRRVLTSSLSSLAIVALSVAAIVGWGAELFRPPTMTVFTAVLLYRTLLPLLLLHAACTAADMWSSEEGARLLPVVGVGWLLGVGAGRWSVLPIDDRWGSSGVELLAIAYLVVAVATAWAAERRWRRQEALTSDVANDAPTVTPWGYLIALVVVMFFSHFALATSDAFWSAHFSAKPATSWLDPSTSHVRFVGGGMALLLLLFALARFIRAAGMTTTLLAFIAVTASSLAPVALLGSQAPRVWGWAFVVGAMVVTPTAVVMLVLLVPLPSRKKLAVYVPLALPSSSLGAAFGSSAHEILGGPKLAAQLGIALCACSVPLAMYLGRRFTTLTRDASAGSSART